MKKLVVLISLLICVFSLFLFFYLRAHDYELEYELNDVSIRETFNKKDNYYQFTFKYEKEEYSIISFDKYTNKRKLISDIEVKEENGLVCLIPESKTISAYTVCSKDKELISYNYDDSIKKEKIDEYDGYNIYDLDSNNYLLWNYNHFVLLKNNLKDKISLFAKDIYNINLVTTLDNYLIIPDYDESYSFDKVYLIDVDKNKTKEINLRYEVYFDSYFLGNSKKLVYLYDKKEEQEYYINIKNEKIYKTDNKILVNNNWENVSSYKLKEEKVKFANDIVYNYKVINNKLYSYIQDDKYLTKISDMDIKTIVKVDKFDVYFISDNTLYKYNPYEGFKALISHSEWDFNYNNMAFIFN